MNAVLQTYPNRPFMQPLYDLTFVNAIAKDNPEFIRSLLDVFLRTVPADKALLIEALSKNDYAQISRTAHKLKSTIDTMQVNQLVLPIRSLEVASREACDELLIRQLTLDVVGKLDAVLKQVSQDPLLAIA